MSKNNETNTLEEMQGGQLLSLAAAEGPDYTDYLQSPTLLAFLGAFIKAQDEYGQLVKDKSNPFFNSKYADLADVKNAVEEPLRKHGIVILQRTIPTDGGMHLLWTQLMHAESVEYIGSLWVLTEQPTPQAEGSAITYARRYQLQTIVGVAPVDDDGEAATQPHRNGNNSRRRSQPAKAEPEPESFRDRAEKATTVDDLKAVWRDAAEARGLTTPLRQLLERRAKELESSEDRTVNQALELLQQELGAEEMGP